MGRSLFDDFLNLLNDRGIEKNLADAATEDLAVFEDDLGLTIETQDLSPLTD